MKRTSANKSELKLKRRLSFVRTTVRELTPAELEAVNGGAASCGYTLPTTTL